MIFIKLLSLQQTDITLNCQSRIISLNCLFIPGNEISGIFLKKRTTFFIPSRMLFNPPLITGNTALKIL